MQNKHKVTLYIPPELHKKLKIKAALDTESMSAMVEKAVAFYLQHPDKVEEIENSLKGKTHQVHVCPECDNAMVMRDGEMVSLSNSAGVIADEIALEVRTKVDRSQGEEELVPCL